jgi:hypothetical protein
MSQYSWNTAKVGIINSNQIINRNIEIILYPHSPLPPPKKKVKRTKREKSRSLVCLFFIKEIIEQFKLSSILQADIINNSVFTIQ